MTETLRIVPLGGLGEVGKNMMCIEYGRNILVIDAGIMFPESDMLGIDYIIPDWQYLRDKKDLIRAIVITHGHEDHIGGLSHFLEEFNVPVYATRLTRGLIEVKLKQKHMLEKAKLHTFAPGDVIDVGPFTIEPYHVCHSIPDGVGLGITTPAGLIVHSGRGVLALLSDSTNADSPGNTQSEAVLDDAFHQVMRQAPGRVIVATFASLISRIQQVVDVATRHDRKIAIAGRSMIENTKMARELGYLDIPEGTLVTLDEINRLPARRIVIMATGTQGEPTAVLNRLAIGQHRSLRVQDKDTVVLSSHTIPGNEELIHRVVNRLFQKGADVYYDPMAAVHVSGHASQEEQKLLINLLRPRYFVPIHGELRHLKQHGKIARQLGIPAENIAVVENGYVLSFEKHLEVGERVPGSYVFVDGARVGEIGPAVMREREELGRNGFVMSTVRYARRTGQPVGRPRIITRGFIFVPGAEDLLAEAEEITLAAASAQPGTPPDEVEKQVQAALSRFLYRKTRSHPTVIPVVVEA
jgi:ribonuclease J